MLFRWFIFGAYSVQVVQCSGCHYDFSLFAKFDNVGIKISQNILMIFIQKRLCAVNLQDKLFRHHFKYQFTTISIDGTDGRLHIRAKFDTYIRNNRHLIPNYGEKWRYGETISTSFVESTINKVIAKRMVKKQQMQWTHEGAHYLL